MTIQTNKLKTPMEKAIEQTLIINQDNRFMKKEIKTEDMPGKMTLEQAKQILTDNIPLSTYPDGIKLVLKARGFIEGHESREVEIANIKAQWHKAGWDDAMREKTK